MAFKVRLQWRQTLELRCLRWREKVDTALCEEEQGGCCLGEHPRLARELEVTWPEAERLFSPVCGRSSTCKPFSASVTPPCLSSLPGAVLQAHLESLQRHLPWQFAGSGGGEVSLGLDWHLE